MKIDTFRCILDVATYIFIFFVIQYALTLILCQGGTTFDASQLTLAHLLSSLLASVLFLWRKWALPGIEAFRNYRWPLFAAAAMLGASLVLPSQGAMDLLGLDLAEENPAIQKAFELMMEKPLLGFLAIGMFGPIAEEIVFRGAILRRLLATMPKEKHWWAIIISAALFALIHGNLVQGLHATAVGIIMGWLYYKTRSIIPSTFLHCTANTLPYLISTLAPDSASDHLIDLFHNNQTALTLSLAASLIAAALSAIVIKKILP